MIESNSLKTIAYAVKQVSAIIQNAGDLSFGKWSLKQMIFSKPEPFKDSDFGVLEKPQQVIVASLSLKLASLGIVATYVKHIEGPLVETFYFKLSPTTPLAKIMNKGEDLALSTGRDSVVVIREGALIAIQVSLLERKKVDFNSCLFRLAEELLAAKLPILLGQLSTGEYSYIDLAEEPHTLIAGSTGSGKSMFLLSTICTLAVAKTTDELKMVIVDSKQVDLALASELPHVIKLCRNALDLHEALDGLLNEMRRRNALMSGIARNIDEYNNVIVHSGGTTLPRILLIIDEFADLIEEDYSQAKAKIEPHASFTRIAERLRSLAQLSRASGIHIIAATQRPSVKITSGDLKVNLPMRIAFKLTSNFDSKTVLRKAGAESLLGGGDMLVQSVGKEKMFRAHAPYVELDTLAAILMNSEGVRFTLQQAAQRARQAREVALLGKQHESV